MRGLESWRTWTLKADLLTDCCFGTGWEESTHEIVTEHECMLQVTRLDFW